MLKPGRSFSLNLAPVKVLHIHTACAGRFYILNEFFCNTRAKKFGLYSRIFRIKPESFYRIKLLEFNLFSCLVPGGVLAFFIVKYKRGFHCG